MTEKNIFEVVDLLTSEDFETLCSIITRHVAKKLGTSIELAKYHKIVSKEQHMYMASKTARVLTRVDTESVLELSSIKRMLNNHPGYQIANVVYDSKRKENRPEVYLRLVRPGQRSDVGTPHCDFWFDKAMGTNIGRGNTLKLWVPIVIEPGKNGLLFYPEAPEDIPFKILCKNGLSRPLIDCELSVLGKPVLPEPTYGQAIKFADYIVHCGALNNGMLTRVSLEITLIKGK